MKLCRPGSLSRSSRPLADNFLRIHLPHTTKPPLRPLRAGALQRRGGMLATDIIEYLKRPLMSLVATRDGADEPQPLGAIFGTKVMIINEFAGSGGDAMPWYFRRVGAPDLMDGGFASAPSSAVYNPNSDWEVENRGIPPDIEVEHDPEQVRQGRDPQLEKAVQVVLEELEKNPVPQPRRPAYPNYHTAKPAPR